MTLLSPPRPGPNPASTTSAVSWWRRYWWLLALGGAASPFAGALVLALSVAAIFGGDGGRGNPIPSSTTLKPGTVPAAYLELVTAAGTVCPAFPAPVIAAQIQQESGWNPNAVSFAGAQGISQFMPSTWPSWSAPGQSPFDPAAAIPAQAKYDCALAAQITAWQHAGKLPTTIGLTQLALAAYNAGPNAVLAAGGIPRNNQTPDYVTRITALAAQYTDTTTSTGVVETGSGVGAAIITAAQAEIGISYIWAGGTYTGPNPGFDCSGLVMYAVYQATHGKVRLPHLAASQITAPGTTPISDRTQLQAGDLIAFSDPGVIAAHHIGIYIGDQHIIDAPETGTNVRIDSLTTRYYQTQTWTMARVTG